MAKNLAGKIVLITGASSGIGRSTAFEFARTSPSSLKLILTARRVDRLHDIAYQIREEVGNDVRVCIQQLDVSNPDEVEALIAGLPEEFRDVDILVNNAGFMSGFEQAPDIPQDVIRDVWATNVTGTINMTQAVLKVFKKRPNGGRGDVIMLGSIAGREAYAGGSIYCSSKAAVRAFTDALRKELINTRIRIMSVDPGQVLTEFNNIRYRFDQEQANKVYAGCDPLSPDDVAEVIVFAAGRRDNVVVADTLMFPSHQASATHIYRTL
ncbi:NAD(P)-binding protein [Cucurbitaria berberidis CBS 394.84]|uniref:NAD(P)-binding protein n=1 Tax=Cucurbitaria berberidis CBS 394.84 TaxID=1168544 RepID=A0A9P4LAP6_9PLEO|nr:NAD(P)-binding protein [Cucurbitaria berberidis CBS 394.84]KAF1847733.1 NAD(P)-binding protein [Cucurbitaria berberidis CBS 394.84]